MAILKRLFSQHERGVGDEDWYYLARNTETGQVFVYHELSHRKGDDYESGNEHIDFDAFWKRQGTVPDRLRALIGTLIQEGGNA